MRDFKEILFLTQIVYSKTQAKLLDEDANSKETLLHQLIINEGVKNDKEACLKFYEEYPSPNYVTLKSRLVERLQNHLFFLSDDKVENLVAKVDEMKIIAFYHKGVAFFNLGHYKPAYRIFRKALKKAIEFSFTEYITLTLTHLLELAAFYYDHKRLNEYKSLYFFYSKVAHLENMAHLIHVENTTHKTSDVRKRKNYLQITQQHIAQLEELIKESGTFKIYQILYFLKLRYYEMAGQFGKIIELTRNPEQFFNNTLNKRFDSRRNNFLLIYAHLASRQIEEGLQLAEHFEKEYPEVNSNYYLFTENYILLFIYSRQYERAYEKVLKMIKDPFFNKLKQKIKERYFIMQLYLQFLTGRETEIQESIFSNFIHYAEDLEGMKVHLLILKFFYYLRNRMHDQLIDFSETLNRYAVRYLKTKGTKRAKNFVALLTSVVKHDFKYGIINDRGRYLFQQLKMIPQANETITEMELVPFDQLWEFVQLILPKERHRVKSDFRS